MTTAQELIEVLRKLYKALMVSLRDLRRSIQDRAGIPLPCLHEKGELVMSWVFPDRSVLKATVMAFDELNRNHRMAIETA